MDANEMQEKARAGVSRKLAEFYGQKKEVQQPEQKYKSYEEAKAAGDVKGMIGKKLEAGSAAKRGVISLTNELYESMDIKQIMRERKKAEKRKAEAKEFRDNLYEEELQKHIKEFSKVGGLSEDMVKGKAIEAVESDPSDALREAYDDFAEAKKRYTALNNCVDRYKVENADLIEAELTARRREELISSGILEELGVNG
jgi:murein L,D-transpeptidase YcbB/YkuD